MSIRKVLIAVDNEPVAAQAAAFGIELARSLGAEVALVHVARTGSAYGDDTGVPLDVFEAEAQQEGRQLLADLRQRFSLPASTLEFFPTGDPPQEIVKAASEWPADLLVIGSHGRGGIRRVALGSVAEGVMRRVPCPVVVVTAKA